jgi:competence protein ComEC
MLDLRGALGVVAAGVVAGALAADAWLPPWLLLLAGGAVAGFACRRPGLRWAGLALLALAVGAARVRTVRGTPGADDVSRLALPLRTVLVGRVVAPPDRRPGRTVLVVAAEAVGRGDARRPVRGLVRLGVRGREDRLGYGDRLRVETTLRRPRSFANPGSFDWAGHLARRGIRATASVWDATTIERLPRRDGGPRAGVERWRTRVRHAIAAAVPGAEGAVLQALVVGDQGDVDDTLREAFTRAGVVHVLSVSGLHVTLVAATAFAVARWLLARSERLLLAVDVGRVAAFAALGPVATYTALAGGAIATLRSALMVAAVAVAGALGRRGDVLRALAAAALLLTLAWPASPREISFQLSFASVLAIVLAAGRFGAADGGWRAWLWNAGLVSPAALLGTAPLTAFYFHQVSLASVVANPIAAPLFGGLAVVPGLAGAVLEPLAPAIAAWAFAGAGLVLRLGLGVVRAAAAPPWAAVDVPIPSLVELALLYGLLAGIVLRPGRWRRLVLAAALSGLLADAAWWTHERVLRDDLRVTFLDVGQGDAAVVELPRGGVLVVDAGGMPGSDFDTGAAIVAPFLLARKILRVDALVMSHAHPDHSGGLAYLLARLRPRELWWTGHAGGGLEWERLRAALGATGVRTRVLGAGGAPRPDTVVLHPPPAWTSSLNDASLTLRVARGAVGVLLTGDVEQRAEWALLRRADALASTVLKVPHHGSRTSSTPAFVAAVDPAVAVVSVGADNRYRLPAPEVEARYRARGTCVLRTDRCGAVTVETDGARLAVRTVLGCACPAGATPPG